VLAAGSLSDRFGRKGALITGLAVFGLGTTAGSLATTTGELIAARWVMGIGAAIVFPNTLSILSNVFTDRTERAKAIGIWAATTGMGVAFGPIVGGWLLEHFWWGSAFLAMAPVAALAIVLVARAVPTSRDPETPKLDVIGLTLSTVALGTLVYTIIEAPGWGWGDSATLTGFAAAAMMLVVFVVWEQRIDQPMLDVRLFTNLRFSAASGSVTVAFFALSGFIFMITMYFQFMHGYSPFSTGLRTLPVAISMAASSVTGTKLAVRFGNKLVVSTGLLMMAVAFVWISRSSAETPYIETVFQMLLTAAGMGFTSAPATEAIMGVVPKEKAGIGSAINDATRELGGTLGVAVIGSVFTSIYVSTITSTRSVASLAPDVIAQAKDSVGGALIAANNIAASDPAGARALATTANVAFFDGFTVGCIVAGAVALVGAVFAARFLPARPTDIDQELAELTQGTDGEAPSLALPD